MLFLTIIFSIFVAGAEIDIAIPSFPEMQKVFGLTPFLVEMVLGINLLAHCISALVVGNLGDRYGKKRVINYGFMIFIIGSVMCAMAPNFTILLLGRIIQGAGVAPAMVLSFIIAIDKYPKESQEKVMGMLNGIATLSICVAPVIGSYITMYFGWKGNFWLLGALGLIALIAFEIVVPCDKKNDRQIKISLKEYVSVLKHKVTFLYIMVLCLVIGAYYTFVGLAPILYIESLGVSLANFGFYQGALTLTFGIFSIVSGSVMKLIGKKIAFYSSLGLILLFMLASTFVIATKVSNPIVITGVMLLLSIGFVIPCNIMFVRALDTIPGAKGKISALVSTIKWVFAIIGLQSASYFYTHNYVSTGIAITLMVGLAFILSFSLWKHDPLLKQSVNS